MVFILVHFIVPVVHKGKYVQVAVSYNMHSGCVELSASFLLLDGCTSIFFKYRNVGLIKQHETGICSITENLSVSLLSSTKLFRVVAQALSRLSYEPRKKKIECHK